MSTLLSNRNHQFIHQKKLDIVTTKHKTKFVVEKEGSYSFKLFMINL